jgi:hypothetical protein
MIDEQPGRWLVRQIINDSRDPLDISAEVGSAHVTVIGVGALEGR